MLQARALDAILLGTLRRASDSSMTTDQSSSSAQQPPSAAVLRAPRSCIFGMDRMLRSHVDLPDELRWLGLVGRSVPSASLQQRASLCTFRSPRGVGSASWREPYRACEREPSSKDFGAAPAPCPLTERTVPGLFSPEHAVDKAHAKGPVAIGGAGGERRRCPTFGKISERRPQRAIGRLRADAHSSSGLARSLVNPIFVGKLSPRAS